MLALWQVHRDAASRGFLVSLVHVLARLAHRLDAVVERQEMRAIAAQGEAGSGDGLDRAQAVSFDAGYLNQPRSGIAGHAKVMFQRDFRCVLYLSIAAAERRTQARRGHRGCAANLALASYFGP